LLYIQEIKLELKAYFTSLITGNQVNFQLEDKLNKTLQIHVIKAKFYVLKENKEFQNIVLNLNNIFLRVKFLFSKLKFINKEIQVKENIIPCLSCIILNLDNIMLKLIELFTLISNLNALILLSLKEKDKEFHEDINERLENLKLVLDGIKNEIDTVLILELDIKKIEFLLLHTNIANNLVTLLNKENEENNEKKKKNKEKK